MVLIPSKVCHKTGEVAFRRGRFWMDGPPAMRSNVELHQGWFNETLPAFVEQHSGPVSFVHLDADLYASTRTGLALLGPRFVEGTVLQFDEYFNYPGWEQGEFRAFEEFVSWPGIGFEYIGYCDGRDNFEQVAVRITSTPPAEASP